MSLIIVDDINSTIVKVKVQANANYIRFTLGQSASVQNNTTLNSSGAIMICGTYETND